MHADIHGKISRMGSNLSERLEDHLTGNVIGALRYIPFSIGLGKVLANGVYPRSVGEDISNIDNEYWANHLQFWPYDAEGEIDALIDFPHHLLGIEVKFMSGLSSDDEVSNPSSTDSTDIHIQSMNQLARESRILSKRSKHKEKLLLFIADRISCKAVYSHIIQRNILERDVKLAYISWQDFLHQLMNLDLQDAFHQLIVQDIIALLKRKGFEDFRDFTIEIPNPINEKGHYSFHLQNRMELCFTTNLAVNEGDFYEFRR